MKIQVFPMPSRLPTVTRSRASLLGDGSLHHRSRTEASLARTGLFLETTLVPTRSLHN